MYYALRDFFKSKGWNSDYFELIFDYLNDFEGITIDNTIASEYFSEINRWLTFALEDLDFLDWLKKEPEYKIRYVAEQFNYSIDDLKKEYLE